MINFVQLAIYETIDIKHLSWSAEPTRKGTSGFDISPPAPSAAAMMLIALSAMQFYFDCVLRVSKYVP